MKALFRFIAIFCLGAGELLAASSWNPTPPATEVLGANILVSAQLDFGTSNSYATLWVQAPNGTWTQSGYPSGPGVKSFNDSRNMSAVGTWTWQWRSLPSGTYNTNVPTGTIMLQATTVVGAGTPTTFTFSNLSQAYTGSVKSATVIPNPAGAAFTADVTKGPGVGTYTVTATAKNGFSGSGSATLEIVAPPANPPTPTAALVATLPGSVSVDNKGSANYSIPLALPPGRAGLQPSLSLNYNSSAGNGPMGIGWAISYGPSEITRGRTLLARDGFVRGITYGADDRLYLDGRLLVISSGVIGDYWKVGSVYHTEVDSFVKITSLGANGALTGTHIEGFKIEAKDGTVSYFGNIDGSSADALHRFADYFPEYYGWSIKRVVDTLGNSIEYTYNVYQSDKFSHQVTYAGQLTGEHLLAGIDYTKNTGAGVAAAFGIRLTYTPGASAPYAGELRPDAVDGYTAGLKSEMHRRLAKIEVGPLSTGTIDPTIRYDFSYEIAPGSGLSRLQNVVFNSKANATSTWQATPPTVFSYNDDGSVGVPLSDPVSATVSGILESGDAGSPAEAMTNITGDFNGDGITDKFVNGKVYLGNGTGFSDGQNWMPNPSPFTSYPCFVKAADINGDGLTDIVWMMSRDKIYAARSTGTGFTGISADGSSYLACTLGNNFFDSSAFTNYPGAAAARVTIGDFNGDGRSDILIHRSNNQLPGTAGLYVALSTGTGFAAPAQWGSVASSDTFYESFSGPPGDPSAWANQPFVTQIEPTVADFNNDGVDDYVYVQRSVYYLDQGLDTYLEYETTLNAGLTNPNWPAVGGGQIQNLYNVVTPAGTNTVADVPVMKVLVGDCDGDGYKDLLVLSKKSWSLGVYEPKWCLFKSLGTGGFADPIVDYMPLVDPVSGVPNHNLDYVNGSGYNFWYFWGGELRTGGMYLQDINKDGKADFIYGRADGWLVKYGQQNGFGPSQPLWANNQGSFWSVFGPNYTPYADENGFGGVSMESIDIDGDGATDWLLSYLSPGSYTTSYVIAKGRNAKADHLNGVTNGLGGKTQIGYKATTDASVYTPGAAVSYPIREVRNPQLVVSDVWNDAGVGNATDGAHFTYQYSGNRADLSGRGPLGFHSFVTLDTQTGLFGYQFLTQSFPMTGLTTREETYRWWNANGNDNFRFISSHDNTVVFDRVGSGNGASVYPFISQATEYRWEDSTTAHFSFTAASANAQAESLFTQTKPSGEHIKITAQSLFDDQTAVQTTLPGIFYASDINAGANAPAGTTNFTGYLTNVSNLGGTSYGKITFGNLKKLTTNYGPGLTETVDTTYLQIGALTGLVDTVKTTAVTGEVAPIKSYTYDVINSAQTPLVKTEKVDAGAAGVTHADSKLTTKVTYARDSLGRVTGTSIDGTDLQSAGQGAVSYTTSSVPSPSTDFSATFDLPTKIQDNYNHVTTTAYHSLFGKPSSVTDANGAQVTTAYDGLGRTIIVTDILRNISTTSTFAWTSSIASDWTKTQTVGPPSGVTGVTLTSVYAVQTATTVKPAVTAYYDRLGRVIRTVKEGFGTKLIYTDIVYNILGQVVATSLPYFSDGTAYWTKTTYDPMGRVSTVTAPNGTVTTNNYIGRATKVSVDAPDLGGINPAAQITTTLVDAKGRTVSVWNADNEPAFTDNVGTTSTGPSISFALDGFGRMTTTTLKGQSQTVTAGYDALGHQTQLADPDKGTWNYVNSALGQVLSQTDAAGNSMSSTFDQLNRQLSRVTTGNSATETANFYYYEINTVTDGLHHTVAKGTQGWLGSPEREECTATGSFATTNLHYYNEKGLSALELAQSDGKWFYTYSEYDLYSRVRQVRHYWKPANAETPGTQPYLWQDFGYFYTYDGSGIGSKSYLVGLTDSLGRSWWDTPVYDYMDRVTSVRKGSGLTTTRTYRPEDGVLTASNNGVQNFSFGFDGLGNLTSRGDGVSSEALTYDALNRLKTSKQGTMTYADNGNILNKPDVGGVTSSGNFTYGPTVGSGGSTRTLPHAVASAFGYTMAYDLNGNLLTRSKSGDYSTVKWTGFDKPRWMTKTSAALSGTAQTAVGSEFHYNAARSRVMQLEFNETKDTGPTKYNRKRIYALGSTLELNYTTTAPALSPNWDLKDIRIYVPGPDGIIGAREFDPTKAVGQQETSYIYHYDHLGSITAITDFGAGTVSNDTGGKPGKFSEDAWGQRRNPFTWLGAPISTGTNKSDDGGFDSLTPRGFTGHEMLDDLGLVHMNGRIYDPLLGRFLSADVVVQAPANLQSYNRYSYAMNKPLTLIDPSGYTFKSWLLGLFEGFSRAETDRGMGLYQHGEDLRAGQLYLLGFTKEAKGVIDDKINMQAQYDAQWHQQETNDSKQFNQPEDSDRGSGRTTGRVANALSDLAVDAAAVGSARIAENRLRRANVRMNVHGAEALPVENSGVGPLRPSARPLLKNEGVLIGPKQGLQSSKNSRFTNTLQGKHGDPASKYLWTIDKRGVNVALEKTPMATPRGNIVHTNISSEASIGGEAWFGPQNTVTINAGSGRFGDGAGAKSEQWDAAVKYWEGLGYTVNPIPLGKR